MKELDGTKYCLAGTQGFTGQGFRARWLVARSSRFFSLDIFFEKVSRSSENSRFEEPFLFLFLFYLSDRSYRKLRSYGMCENMGDYDF